MSQSMELFTVEFKKIFGPAGVVIVIIREDLITEDTLPGTPDNDEI